MNNVKILKKLYNEYTKKFLPKMKMLRKNNPFELHTIDNQIYFKI